MHPSPWTDPLFLATWLRLLAAATVLALAWSSARAANRRLFGRTPWDLDVCAATVLVAACVVGSAIAIGAFGWLTGWTWAVGVAIAAGALRIWSTGRPGLLARTRARGPGPSPAFLVALGGVLLGRAFFGLRNPPADVDTLVYHLPMVAYWLRTGSLGAALAEPPVAGTYFPGNGEVLQLAAAWAVGRETLMPWTGLLGIGLLGLALRRTCVIAGAAAPVAEAIALCLSAAPGAVRLTLGTRVDVLLAAWFAAALLFALRYRRGGQSADLAIMLCSLGLLAGTKTVGPAYALFVLALAVGGPAPAARLGAPLRCPGSLLTALLLGGFWFARNALASGNPLYPATIRLGPWTWSGPLDGETLRRTTQISMWLEGYAGHLTPASLLVFFGPAIVLTAAGLLLWAWHRLRRPWSRRRRRARPIEGSHLAWLAGACLVVFLVVPFSGASVPAGPGKAPWLSIDNVRYLLPAAVCVAPLAAIGLSRLHAPGLIVLAAGAAFLAGLWRTFGHVLPGIAAAAALAVAAAALGGRLGRPAFRRAAALVAGSAGIALAVVAVEPMRERLSDRIWDSHTAHHHNLPASVIRDLRESAAGRPIACVGVYGWWAFYGRDFSGRPVYVPVATEWARASRPYRFARDPRERADRDLWRRNLARSGAAFVVVIDDACEGRPVESGWCAADSAGFRLGAALGCDAVYEVRGLEPR